MSIRFLLAAASIAALGASSAQAALTITSQPTNNVDCTGGVCTATATHANLNADDLVALLQSGDVKVVSGHRAKDIVVNVGAQLEWGSAHRLALDSFRSITITKPIFYAGNGGGLDLTIDDGGSGGTLNYGDKGHIYFINADLATLTINGANYKLARNVQTLAGDIFSNQTGNFALSQPYNAGVDGTYLTDPITTVFMGHFEGLGNTIRNLRINVKDLGVSVGLFYANTGTISHLRLVGAKVEGSKNDEIGAIAGFCHGAIDHVEVSGQVQGGLNSSVGGVCGILDANLTDAHSSARVTGTGDRVAGNQGSAGGLVGMEEGGTVSNSSASGNVLGGKGWTTGGLVGHNQGSIQLSFASGTSVSGDSGISGGLVGSNAGSSIANSYATGTTQGGVNSSVGGLLGTNDGTVTTSYSSGPVASGSGNAVGGFVGNDIGSPDLANDYFDIDTSGQSHGAGNNTGDPGITGLSNADFQAGLPSGFDPAVWGQSAGINGGLPYLLANPPQ